MQYIPDALRITLMTAVIFAFIVWVKHLLREYMKGQNQHDDQ